MAPSWLILSVNPWLDRKDRREFGRLPPGPIYKRVNAALVVRAALEFLLKRGSIPHFFARTWELPLLLQKLRKGCSARTFAQGAW